MSDWEDDDMYDDGEEEFSFEEEEDEEDVDAIEATDGSGSGSDNGEEDGESDEANHFSKKRKSIGEMTIEDVESKYFWGKELRQDERVDEALKVFLDIIKLKDSEKPSIANNEYIFKSMKQAMKTCYDLNDYDQLLQILDLVFIELPKVGKNYGDSSLSKISTRYDKDGPTDFLASFYDKIITYLESTNEITKGSQNERLWVRITLRKANMLVVKHLFDEALVILELLETRISDSSESIRNAFLLEIVATRMQIINEDKSKFNLKELKKLCQKADSCVSAVPQARLIGIVKECSGIVSMYLKDFKKANICFQDSFKGFNEGGDDRRLSVLNKLIITNLLSESEINPFESHEFQVYLQNDQVKEYMKLYQSFQDLDITKYYDLLKRDSEIVTLIESNEFIREFMPLVTKKFQERFILKYIIPFKSIKFDLLSRILEISNPDLEKILLTIYGKGKLVNYKLDLVNSVIFKNNYQEEHSTKIHPLEFMDRLQYLNVNNQDSKLMNSTSKSPSFTQSSASLSQKITSGFPRKHTKNESLEFELGDSRATSVVDSILFHIKPEKTLLKPFLGATCESCSNKEEMFAQIRNYHDILFSALPKPCDDALTHVEKVQMEKFEKEKEELRQLHNNEKRQRGIDSLVPEVIQNTTMAALDLSGEQEVNEPPANYKDVVTKVSEIGEFVGTYQYKVMSILDGLNLKKSKTSRSDYDDISYSYVKNY